jgi:peptidoglycan/LPS O-acetylase OafA/YrhL
MEGVPNLGHFWSIGVEEQFYLIWPLLLKFSKKPMRTIWLFLVSVLLFKFASFAIIKIFFPSPPVDSNMIVFTPVELYKNFVGSLKFEAMAMGGIGACWVFYRNNSVLQFIFSKPMQWIALTGIPIIILFTPVQLYLGLYLFFSVPSLLIIVNVAANPNCLFRLQGRTIDYLGKISYGIYMYHIICIAFVFNVLNGWFDFPKRLETWQTALLYAFSIPLTIGVAALSYHYLEYPFIRKKRTFTTVISGDDARD